MSKSLPQTQASSPTLASPLTSSGRNTATRWDKSCISRSSCEPSSPIPAPLQNHQPLSKDFRPGLYLSKIHRSFRRRTGRSARCVHAPDMDQTGESDDRADQEFDAAEQEAPRSGDHQAGGEEHDAACDEPQRDQDVVADAHHFVTATDDQLVVADVHGQRPLFGHTPPSVTSSYPGPFVRS